ncbi:MAG: hypothetical protein FJW39_21420 [Acidobacteria bacterium]|nr:hypothetical protein [Acidobacteriota bacterium]
MKLARLLRAARPVTGFPIAAVKTMPAGLSRSLPAIATIWFHPAVWWIGARFIAEREQHLR